VADEPAPPAPRRLRTLGLRGSGRRRGGCALFVALRQQREPSSQSAEPVRTPATPSASVAQRPGRQSRRRAWLPSKLEQRGASHASGRAPPRSARSAKRAKSARRSAKQRGGRAQAGRLGRRAVFDLGQGRRGARSKSDNPTGPAPQPSRARRPLRAVRLLTQPLATAVQTPSSFPAGSRNWKRRPPGNSWCSVTRAPRPSPRPRRSPRGPRNTG
jgi:hypothetical protein